MTQQAVPAPTAVAPPAQEQQLLQPSPANGAFASANDATRIMGNNRQQYQPQQANHRGPNPNTQHLNPSRPRMNLQEGKILILFDLNGVLTDHTPARQEGK